MRAFVESSIDALARKTNCPGPRLSIVSAGSAGAGASKDSEPEASAVGEVSFDVGVLRQAHVQSATTPAPTSAVRLERRRSPRPRRRTTRNAPAKIVP